MEARLPQRGVQGWLPLVPRESQWKDRKRTILWPLFPSYVFGKFALRDLHHVLGTPGVTAVVCTNGVPAPIPDEEMENVQLLVRSAAFARIGPEPQPLVREGDWVRVEEGPFRGVQGQVVERRGCTRVLVGLWTTGQGIEIDVGVELLRVANRPGWADR